jgi:hypothetical protein
VTIRKTIKEPQVAKANFDQVVERIEADLFRHNVMGLPLKYPSPDETLANGGNLLDMLLPTGKTLGMSTGEEIELVGRAYLHVGEQMMAEKI